MRKKIMPVMLLLCILILTSCKADSSTPSPEPKFPLEESTITAALNELSLDWAISVDETQMTRDANRETVLYSLRDPEKKLNEESEYTILYAGISSGFVDGKRCLSVTLNPSALDLNEKPFAWEDWKKEIILATILYGGYEEKEEVYEALSRIDVPEGEEGYQCGVNFSNGYCTVKKSRAQRTPSSSVRYVLWVDFYESEEAFHKMIQEAIPAE